MIGHDPVPEGLAWDLFLGPAPQVEYSPVCHPFNRRGWVDWGAGPLGDMSAHLIDHADWALDLGLPTTVETVSMPFNGVCFPHATTTCYEFLTRLPRGVDVAVGAHGQHPGPRSSARETTLNRRASGPAHHAVQ